MTPKPSFNKVELLGHAGADPKITDYEGKRVARFTFATNEQYRDKTGQIQEETTWHNISVWEGDKIMNLDDIRKGSYLYIKGAIRNSRFQGQDGEKHYFTEIRANTIKPAVDDSNEDRN